MTTIIPFENSEKLAEISVLHLMKDQIDETIKSLELAKFKTDPIAGKTFSRITSVTSSAYKRHGSILERAILEYLKQSNRYEAWTEEEFIIPQAVNPIVDGSINSPTKLIGVDYPYCNEWERHSKKLQLDVLVYDKATKTLRSYEVKRGTGNHDRGKKDSILRNALSVQILLRNYGQQRGLIVDQAFSHVVSYYGKRPISKPFRLIGSELDEHFDQPITAALEEVNDYFKTKLQALLGGL